MQELIKKAGILIEALPYIQKFSGKTVVIKYGGNAMINEELKNSVMEDITLLKFIGLNPIVVHGGGPDISKALNERGVKSKFVNGLRVTDDITMQTAQQVLIGKTNKEIVALLNTNGGRAVGISGIDGSFIECKKQYTEVDGEKVDIGYVGDIVHVKHCLIDLLSSDQYIPVIAPIGTDEDGNSYNINADTVAAAVAASVEAEKLILLTDVEGIKDKDGNVIAEGFNAELDELRALKNHGGQFLVDYEAREKERTGIPNLRVEFNSVQGYFIEVPKGQIDKVPADYRRRQTLKNVERYITPELKAFEDKAVSAEERSKALDKQLYEELILKCKPFCQDLLNSAHGVSALDALSSFAQHADTYRWIKPNFVPVTSVEIKGARHPVVEETIENYVPNDCDLDAQHRLHIITGPNMGGKSTYMRSIALIVLLAYSGSFVPAESADIGVIDKILTRIGAADDLARGLSTFMVEMTETASILRQATDKSLVLMDEVGRGTSTFDGLSLAAAIAEDLVVNCRSLTLFATHYFELTQLEKTLPDVVNVHVAAAESSKNIVFLHEIRPGAANQSYGIAVAKLAGIPRSVIRGAQKVLLKLEERAAQTDDKQLDLFVASEASSTVFPEEERPEEDPTLLELRDQLADVSMDDLSPRQAWELLADLQKKAKETK